MECPQCTSAGADPPAHPHAWIKAARQSKGSAPHRTQSHPCPHSPLLSKESGGGIVKRKKVAGKWNVVCVRSRRHSAPSSVGQKRQL